MIEITITITDADSCDEIQAVGATDLKDFFLPRAGIIADNVIITEKEIKLAGFGKSHE